MVRMKSSNQAKDNCGIKKVNFFKDIFGRDIFYEQKIGLKCDIKNSEFTFDTESYQAMKKQLKEYKKNKSIKIGNAEINWPNEKKAATSSLTKQFNISAFVDLVHYFYYYPCIFLHNLYSIELDLLFIETVNKMEQIHLINSDLRFSIDGKPVKTCTDIITASNGTFKINSLSQIPLIGEKGFYLFGCRFPFKIYPLVFD